LFAHSYLKLIDQIRGGEKTMEDTNQATEEFKKIGYGNSVQFGIYGARNASGPRPPISIEEWERQARKVLEDGPYWYVAGGAAAGESMLENRRALDRWRIVPRMLSNTAQRDLSVSFLYHSFPTPVMLAPVGVQSIVHPEGELASARAAASLGVPYIASTAASYPMEEIAEVMGDAPRWFQLYWGKDHEVTASMLQRAEKAGYTALVVTLDTQMLAWREDDLRNRYLPFLDGIGIANYTSDPAFCASLEKSPKEDMEAAVRQWGRIFSNASLTWADLDFLRKHTKLPIILKGILDPHDAELAVYHGVDGIIVSNHGGRQVDGSIAAIDALADVCDVVQDRVPVLMDSGIRRGSDIVKALALGAKAVLVGRPFMYGLSVGGEEGVKTVIQHLLADLDLTMALSGKKSIADLNRSMLKRI
jgi:lactate 2-monooxygenase